MNNSRKVIVLKDKESGVLLPQAGIYNDDNYGEESAKKDVKRIGDVVAVKAILTEIN